MVCVVFYFPPTYNGGGKSWPVLCFISRPHIMGEENHDLCCVLIFRPHITGEENHDLCCVLIFRPHIMGEENHGLCCVLFSAHI